MEFLVKLKCYLWKRWKRKDGREREWCGREEKGERWERWRMREKKKKERVTVTSGSQLYFWDNNQRHYNHIQNTN